MTAGEPTAKPVSGDGTPGAGRGERGWQSLPVAQKPHGQAPGRSSTFQSLFFLRTPNALLLALLPGRPPWAWRVVFVICFLKASMACGRPPYQGRRHPAPTAQLLYLDDRGAEGWLPGRLQTRSFWFCSYVFVGVLSAAFINTVFLFSLSLINFSNFSSPPVQQ